MITVEVRSSGYGPRSMLVSTGMGRLVHDCEEMAERRTRIGPDHKGRMKRLCDGVAVIIRRADAT